jgi:hypothetical protein
MKTQGNERMTEIFNVVGSPETPVMDAARAYGPIVEQADGALVEVTYAGARTISLGNYEFVRMQIGARIRIAPGESADAAFDAVNAFVGEIIAREEALVRKNPRDDGPLENLPGVRREVWVEYGMTLNAKVKFESHRLDIGLSRPLGDQEDARVAMADLESYLSKRAAAERDRLKGAA